MRTLRRLIERIAPTLVVAAVEARDRRRHVQSPRVTTPFGFTFAGNDAMAAGVFEPESVAFFRATLTPRTVFVDVGANIGYFTCLARSLGATVIAVEPLGQNLELLYANLLANAYDDVEVLPVGLAERPGLARLYGGGTSASLLRDWSGNSRAWSRTIPLTTVDAVLGDRFRDRELVIKIDVEGAEFGVLTGAMRTLRRTPRPIWHVEVCSNAYHPGGRAAHFADVFQLFREAGYTATGSGAAPTAEISAADVARWAAAPTHEAGIDFVFRPAAA